MSNVWSDLHEKYKDDDWIDKPSIFVETAIEYFPKNGSVLDLGAGQGQDSRFFAEKGYDVTSTDIEKTALEIAESKSKGLQSKIQYKQVDLREKLPFDAATFDVVYAHLSLHYFDRETTVAILADIKRVLKPGGILAFLVNSVHDPEYQTGEELEPDYFHTDGKPKRYFSTQTTQYLTEEFEKLLLDDNGETYKDAAKGVHNLVRYVGRKSDMASSEQ